MDMIFGGSELRRKDDEMKFSISLYDGSEGCKASHFGLDHCIPLFLKFFPPPVFVSGPFALCGCYRKRHPTVNPSFACFSHSALVSLAGWA